ncbi:MAG: hypothetical protein AABX55_02495 [Nanoarchaeota archaeon]
MDDTIQLGGNISLAGFKELEPAKMIVIKKLTGNYVKKMQEKTGKFESLHLHLKQIHASKYEIQAKAMVNGQPYNAEVINFNLFFALDKSLSKILEEIS